jgi:hypothetical protein
MDSTKFQDDLWEEEIPDYAYIALGRRGREKIMLHECFVHGCGVKDEILLHILQKTETIEKNSSGSSNPTGILLRKYLIHCEQGNHSFHLVFERHGLLTNPSPTEDQDLEEENIVFERVYATDEADQINLGEIGYVQFR